MNSTAEKSGLAKLRQEKIREAQRRDLKNIGKPADAMPAILVSVNPEKFIIVADSMAFRTETLLRSLDDKNLDKLIAGIVDEQRRRVGISKSAIGNRK